MKELTDIEIQWLETLAKNHEFFASFLLHYKLKQQLSNNQHYWLHLYINQAEQQGDTLLTTSEIELLQETSTENEKLKAIYSIYEDKGYLDKANYEEFLSLKAEIMGAAKEVKTSESLFKHKVRKVPCPHCSFLCSPQIQFCSKCGEPLPKLENSNEPSETSYLSEEDYTVKNIIHSLEKLINKSIPSAEKFNYGTTCYVKEGEEIIGLSIFNCGLTSFPQEILRLKSLKYLALRRNNIKRLPKNIGFLSNLEYLDLRINELEKLPNAIGLFIKLNHLNLSSNKLKVIPDSLGELLLLKKLNLSNNKLKTIPECIENLTCLESLNLKANFWVNMPESIEKLKEEGLQIIL